MLHFYFENNKYFIQFPNFKSLEESILEEIDYELKTDEKMIFYDKNNLLIETEEQYKNFKSESNQLLYVHILNKEEEEKKKKEEEEKKKKEEEEKKKKEEEEKNKKGEEDKSGDKKPDKNDPTNPDNDVNMKDATQPQPDPQNPPKGTDNMDVE